MSNLREVRNRINSIRSTKQVTGAMKMVAASKLHKAQGAVNHLRMYENRLREMLVEVNRQVPFSRKHPAVIDRDVNRVLIIAIGSNKGLCGSYNSQVIRHTQLRIGYLEKQKIETRLFLTGKKIEAFFRKNAVSNLQTNHDLIDKLSYEKAEETSAMLTKLYTDGEYDRVEVIYQHFQNAVVQELVIDQLLPLPMDKMMPDPSEEEMRDSESGEKLRPSMQLVPEEYGYILEPDTERVLNRLIGHYISYNLFRVFTDAYASEHGARMTSMHHATDNADQLLRELTLTYNKVRQAIITRELMEIVGGAQEQ